MKQYLKIISVFISVFLLGAAIAPGPLPGGSGSTFNPSTTKLSSFAPTTSSELAGVVTNETGSGLLVFGTSPTLTTPTLGAALATSINKLTLTAPTTGATLSLADNSSLITSGAYSTTLTTTGTTSLTLPTTGTLATTSNNLSAFAATSSAQLAGILSDETGSGAAVFATSPSLTTPNIGVATATSVNKVAITAPATSATLTLANGSTLTTAGAYSVTLTATGATSVTLPANGTLLSDASTIAASQIGSGTIGTARLGSGSASSSTYLRGDQTWATIASGVTPAYLRYTGSSARGSTNTNVLRWSTVADNTGGSDLGFTDSSTLGSYFSVSTSGVYSITGNLYQVSGGSTVYLGIGSSVTNISANTETEIRAAVTHGSGAVATLSWTGYIASGSKVWICSVQPPSNTYPLLNQFAIARIN